MGMKTIPAGKVDVVALSGTIGWGEELDRIRDHVARLLSEGHHSIVMDLSGVRIMDSGGVGALATCRARAAQKDARISLVIPANSNIPMVVRTCLMMMFPTFATEKEAIGSMVK